MSSIARSVVHRISSNDHRLIGGITLRLIVFVLAFATWVMMARSRWNFSEYVGISLVVLTGFVSFTSAINLLVQAARGGTSLRHVSDASARDRQTDDPEILASLLIAHAPADRSMLTLGDATRTLVQQVGPLPASRVISTLEVLTRLQWCTPDFDELTEQRCWRLSAPRVTA